MPSPSPDRTRRVATLVVVAVCALIGVLAPGQILLGGVAWLIALVFAAIGWGNLVSLVMRSEVGDVGLRISWGVSALIAVAGPLVAAGIATRMVLLFLIAIGLAAFAWREWHAETPAWRHAARLLEQARAHPVTAGITIAVAAVVVLRIAGAITQLDRNPWDDDLAYTPLVKRLLDCGDLIEPFSLRRLASLGGQTVLQALAGARGSLDTVHLLDHGVGFLAFVLLVLGHARARGTARWWLVLVVLSVALLPEMSINTAAHWTGAALLFALYRSVSAGLPVHAALVGAAACTLRQSYLPVVAVFLAMVAVLHVVARRGELRAWARAAGVFLLVLVPWLVASWRASGTFLFPLQSGTFNTALSLQASITPLGTLELLGRTALESGPLVAVPILAIVLLATTDRRAGRPLTALFVAVGVGFVLLVMAFSGSEPAHLWRYAFGPALALGVATWMELVGASRSEVDCSDLGAWLAGAALVFQIVTNRGASLVELRTAASDVRAAHADPGAGAIYREAQAVIPDGERVAVMVDEARHLDFARSSLVNLDTPGYAGPDGGLPAFAGAAAWRRYFLEHGIRYVLATHSEASVAFFRREFWVWRIFNDSDLFQTMSAYTIDAIDRVAALAREGRVLFDRNGLVVIDLGTAAPAAPVPPGSESARRAAYIRSLADREHLHAAWSISSRDDVRFDDGFSSLLKTEGEPLRGGILPAPFDDTHPARWIFRRARIRLRGAGSNRLALRGELNTPAIAARPTLVLVLDGRALAHVTADDRGGFSFDATVAAPAGTWVDLDLVWSGTAYPIDDAREQRVARLSELTWDPVR